MYIRTYDRYIIEDLNNGNLPNDAESLHKIWPKSLLSDLVNKGYLIYHGISDNYEVSMHYTHIR